MGKEKKRRVKDLLKTTYVPVPWGVSRLIDIPKHGIEILGDQAYLGTGDAGTLEEIREALDWMVEQFGGSVKWEDTDGQ